MRAELRKPAHEVLGVGARAGDAEIRKAYRTLCLAWHPDKHSSASDDMRTRAKHRFDRIQAAYNRLTAAAKTRSSFSYGYE